MFFRPKKAHNPEYSAYRIQQVIQYADLSSTLVKTQIQNNEQRQPKLCIGIPSVRRESISYLKLVLGSLQHGLSVEERKSLYFVVLLAHTNQTEHPDYNQPWLGIMADKLASYNDSEERLRQAQEMESRGHAIKSKFDYSIAMEECAKTEAPYIMMVEDDVVFMDGWRHRTLMALAIATTKSWEAGQANCKYGYTIKHLSLVWLALTDREN